MCGDLVEICLSDISAREAKTDRWVGWSVVCQFLVFVYRSCFLTRVDDHVETLAINGVLRRGVIDFKILDIRANPVLILEFIFFNFVISKGVLVFILASDRVDPSHFGVTASLSDFI